MENSIFLYAILSLTFITAVTQILFFIISAVREKKLDVAKPSYPALDNKAWEILSEAQKKANNILNNAELKGIEYLSRQKMDITKIQGDYVKNIKDLEITLTNSFRESMEKADKSYQGFIAVLQENLRQQELQNQRLFQEKTNKVVESAQNTMTAFITDVNSKVSRQIDDELKAIRNELEMYKNHRIEIINKYIIDILERTLEETLGKKLTLEEHGELIFQALEKAKLEQKLK